MRKIKIEPGQRFGRLTFLNEDEPTGKKGNCRRGTFLCDCGKSTHVNIHSVRYGHTSSCGCFHTERQRSAKSHGATCGRKPLPEYRAWKAMKSRCYDPLNTGYKNYGGRGIKVSPLWVHNFEQFFADVGQKPSKYHTLDRINNDGDYEAGNVRWATRVEQRRNNRQIHPVTVNGETRLICDWAKISGVPEESISSRLRHGWDPERAIYLPVRHTRGAEPRAGGRGSIA